MNGAAIADEADCYIGCAGNTTFVLGAMHRIYNYLNSNILHSEACGGPNRLSVYSSAPIMAFPVPIAYSTELPGLWQYKGCLRWDSLNFLLPTGVTEYGIFHPGLVNLPLARYSHT